MHQIHTWYQAVSDVSWFFCHQNMLKFPCCVVLIDFYLTTQPADCFQPRVLRSRTETQDLSNNISRHPSRLNSHRSKKQRNTVEVKQDTSIPNPDETVYLEAIWQPRQNAKTSVNKSTPKACQRLSYHSKDWEMRLSYIRASKQNTAEISPSYSAFPTFFPLVATVVSSWNDCCQTISTLG